jgi:hypothetical protein
MDLVVGNENAYRLLAFINDQRVPEIEEHPEPEDLPGVSRDAAVAEVEAEYVDVLWRQRVEQMCRVTALDASGSLR